MDDDTPPFAGRPRLFLYYLLAEAKLFHMASPCAPFKEVTPDPTAKFKRMNPVLDKGVQGAVCYANGLLAAGVKGPMGGGAGGASKGGMPSGMSGTCSSTFGIDGTSGPSAADLQAQKNLRFECSFLNLLGGQHPDKALEACMRTNLLATPDDSMLLAIGQILDDLTSALHEALNKVIDDKLGYALEGRTSTAAWNNMQTKVTQTGGVHYIGDPDKFVAACGTEAGPACYHGSDGSIWVFTGSRSMSDIEKDVEHEYGEGYVQEALTAVANDTIKYDPQGTIKGYPDWVKTKAAEILATPGTKKDPNDRPTHRMAQEAVDKLNQEGKFKKKPGTQDCVTDACKAACMERAQLPALMACAAAGMFPSAADKLMFGPGCNGNRCVTDPPSEENSFFPLQTGPAPGKQYCEAAMPTGPDAGGGCGASMSCIGGVPLNKAIWWTDPSPMAHQVLDRVVTFKSPALAPAKTSGKAPDGTTVP